MKHVQPCTTDSNSQKYAKKINCAKKRSLNQFRKSMYINVHIYTSTLDVLQRLTKLNLHQ